MGFHHLFHQHHESNNPEGRIKFMIVKINILGLMSPKRRLIISRVCEIKTVHRLYCEAKLPYLNIYRMIILPVDEFMFLLVWALDADAQQCIQWHLESLSWRKTFPFGDLLPPALASWSSPAHAASVHQWWYGMLLTDRHRSLLPLRFENFQRRRNAEPDTLARRVLETLFSAKRLQCLVTLLRPAQI